MIDFFGDLFLGGILGVALFAVTLSAAWWLSGTRAAAGMMSWFWRQKYRFRK